MNRFSYGIRAVALVATCLGTLATPVRAQARDSVPLALRPGEVHVFMRTALGDIHLAIDTLRAPITATNFLRYVGASLYTGGTFYRTVRLDNQPEDDVRIEVIQGGMDRSRRLQAFPPIPLEGTTTTGLSHLDGTLSMARDGPDSAQAEFFICIRDQPELDAGGSRNPDGAGFAAFGRVLAGMEIVRQIQAREADGQYLTERVAILFAERVGTR